MWKDIKDWESLYEVSDRGQIRNKQTGKTLKGSKTSKGYLQVTLYRDGEPHRLSVHRIVCEAFVPNPDDLPEVNHKDLDKQNNTVENLEWISGRDNDIHACMNGARPYRPFVIVYSDHRIETFDSKSELAKQLGVSVKVVADWLRGESKSFVNFGIKLITFTTENASRPYQKTKHGEDL